jgi:hypothetical protein
LLLKVQFLCHYSAKHNNMVRVQVGILPVYIHVLSWFLQIYSIDEDEKLTSSLEIILPRDLADGFVNNKREIYKFK